MLWEKISKFGVRTVIADTGITHPREGDRFIMQAFFERGYPQDILSRLNRVRIFLAGTIPLRYICGVRPDTRPGGGWPTQQPAQPITVAVAARTSNGVGFPAMEGRSE